MTPTLPSPDEDAVLSREVAREAGQLLLEIRDSFGEIEPGDRERAKSLRLTADREAHLLIHGRLTAARPADSILSEEGDDDLERLHADRVWIVDPLDGTWEYGQQRADFAVHIALWTRTDVRDGVLSAATVDVPAHEQTWSVLDELPSSPRGIPTDRPIRLVTSRSRAPEKLAELLQHMTSLLGDSAPRGVEAVQVGSVGAKAAELFSGRVDAYVHLGGFNEWDLAAPLAVALYRGIAAVSPGGDGFTFNRADPYQSGVIMTVPALLEVVQESLSLLS
jgi:3'(2'), 5'-bisphosphate nucleotidase